MLRKLRGWVYGDKSYYLAHLIIGVVVIALIRICFDHVLEQPIAVILELISDNTVSLSAALLGFQLAGVSVLIALDGNKKLSILKEIESDTMVYKVFLSSIIMFLVSIVLMLVYLYVFANEMACIIIKNGIGYASLITLLFGFVFLFSSIRLLKWLCS